MDEYSGRMDALELCNRDKLMTPHLITEHFTYDELACRCGCGRMEFSDSFLVRLEELRVAFGKPMIITSGYRCPEHNAKVSHTGKTGPHTIGAVDVGIAGPDAYMLVLLAMQLCFSGIGVSQRGKVRFIHIDDLQAPEYPRPRIWSYQE